MAPSLQVPRPVLVDLLVHAWSAARVVGHLGDADGSQAVAPLSDHVDAIVHGLSELLGGQRRTAGPVPAGETAMAVVAASEAGARLIAAVEHALPQERT